MRRRYPSKLPTRWLMTDERMGDALLPSISALPPGSGIIFRHYSLAPKARRALFDAVKRLARKRSLMLILAGSPKLAMHWGADGSHGRHRGALTAPVHSIPERIAAERHGAQLLFVSPVFPTRSHPSAATLGRAKLGLIVRGAHRPVIALGGMTERRTKSLCVLGIYGWAGIDALRIRT
jgi:thiamine-phosphate pyrophosphorylase